MKYIRDLHTDKNGCFSEGKFDSASLFIGKMDVVLFTEDGATAEYAEKCIEHYNSLSSNSALQQKLQEYLAAFFLYMYDEWKAIEIYGRIVDALEHVMEGYKSGKKLIEYLSKPTLYVYAPNGDGVGYGIECNCLWEPEHQCLIIIRNSDLLYVGPSCGLDAWGDSEDYYCIWHDADAE